MEEVAGYFHFSEMGLGMTGASKMGIAGKGIGKGMGWAWVREMGRAAITRNI